MRLNFRSVTTVMLFVFVAAVSVFAQGEPRSTTLSELKNTKPVDTPTTAEVMRGRISKAKALLAVKNYPAAIYELENIRRETNDPTVTRVLNVLLMHSYLEQGEYKRAQKFLNELAKDPAKSADYFAVAGQVVSGARTQLARYKTLGIPVSDGSLPEAAKSDLDGMRQTLELVVTQSKSKSRDKKTGAMAAAVVEESSVVRGDLARDAYDQKRWKDQVSDARQQIVDPGSEIIDAVEKPITSPDVTLVATTLEKEPVTPEVNKTAKVEEKPAVDLVAKDESAEEEKPAVPATDVVAKVTSVEEEKQAVESDIKLKAVEEKQTTAPVEKKSVENPVTKSPSGTTVARRVPTDRKVRIIGSAEKRPTSDPLPEQPNVKSTDQVAREESAKRESKPKPKLETEPRSEETVIEAKGDSPLNLGSLIAYATKRVNPVYPSQARSLRMQGTVKVKVLIDEEGKVAKVENASGPALLKRAARNAIRRWEFRPFMRDGQPVKASGYVSFNFNL